MTKVEIPQDHTSLIDGLKPIYGSSDVANLREATLGLDGITQHDITAEIYRGEHDGVAQLGVVATRFHSPDVPPRFDFSLLGGTASDRHGDAKILHGQYSLEGVRDVLEIMGVKARSMQTAQGEVIEAVMPEHVADWNTNLKKLGITDREFTDFEGEKFSLVDQLIALAERKILLATGIQEGLHDRAGHSMSYVFASEELFSLIVDTAAKLLEQRKKVTDDVGIGNIEEIPEDLTRDDFEKLLTVSMRTKQFGMWLESGLFDTYKKLTKPEEPHRPSRFRKAKEPTRRHDVALAINGLDVSSRRGEPFLKKGQAEHLADTCIAWNETLIQRASKLLHT